MKGVASIVVAALLVGAVVPAGAVGRKILLIDDEVELRRALEVALSPWDVTVEVVRAPAPEAAAPSAMRAACALARANGADAVVWIAGQVGERALWIYDADSGGVVVRPLPEEAAENKPLAAAVALSVKTILRSGGLATVNAPAPPPLRSLAMRGLAARGRGHVEIESTVAVHLPGGDVGAGPRLGLSVGYWPVACGGWCGLALGFGVSPGRSVDRSDVAGELLDLAVTAEARSRINLGGRLFVVPALGMSWHRVALGATPLVSMASEGEWRGVSADGSLLLGLRLGERFHLGARAGLGLILGHRGLVIDRGPAIRLPALDAELGLFFGGAL